MKPFIIKRGDTSPSLLYALSPTSINLTGATVVFNMKEDGAETNIVNRAVAAVETPTGTPTLRYDWIPANTAVPGTYLGEFEVRYVDGSIETFPNKGFILIEVGEDLG